MKIKRKLSLIMFYLSFVSLSLLLSGCQLALPEDGMYQGGIDELCGVLVTLGDQNVPMDENIVQDLKFKNKNGVLTLDESSRNAMFSQKVEGKVSEDGHTIVFDGIQGYYLGEIQYSNVNGELDSLMTSGENFHDVKYDVKTTDHETSMKCEATIFVSNNFNDLLKINPVFLREDGSYYTDLGGGQGISSSGLVTGSAYSLTLDTSSVKTSGDNSSAENRGFTVHIKAVDAVEKVMIKEINQMDELIKATSYLRDYPSEVVVDPDTSYVIVEETTNATSQNTPVKRSIYTIVDDNDTPVSHSCNFENENGVILNQTIQFVLSSRIKKDK